LRAEIELRVKLRPQAARDGQSRAACRRTGCIARGPANPAPALLVATPPGENARRALESAARSAQHRGTFDLASAPHARTAR